MKYNCKDVLDMPTLGCKLPLFDARDYKLNGAIVSSQVLPDKFELTDLPDIKNQWSTNSCVAHAISSILEYHTKNEVDLSTQFIYGIQKKETGHDGMGMYLRDACKIVHKYGDMTLNDCPGNQEIPKCYSPAEESLEDEEKVKTAYQFRVQTYYGLNSIDDIKYALVNHGPVLGSLKWLKHYKCDKKTGILSSPDDEPSGYHAIVIYGYNEIGFMCQNSWGDTWGKDGRFIIPYETPIVEAWGLIDYINEDEIIVPDRKWWKDILYSAINFIVNAFLKLFKKR